MAITTHILGYPRIGKKRELKFALESYWRGESSQAELEAVGQELRARHWQEQQDAGLSFVTAGDFAWYDHVLTTSLLLGHVPARHGEGHPDLNTLFRIGRGQSPCGCCAAASDMTKWFNTNYHYIVPEFHQDDSFDVQWPQLFNEIQEAQKSGHQVKPVLLGPITYLWLGKTQGGEFDKLELLPRLLSAYQKILARLKKLGVEWLQIDEPALVQELPEAWLKATNLAYQTLHGDVKLLLTTYFDHITHQLETIKALRVDGLHIDVAAAPEQLNAVAAAIPSDWVLSVGVVNGRNVWRADLANWYQTLAPIAAEKGDRFWLASSCSLLHSPMDLAQEQKLDAETQSWFSFAKQKLSEITLLAKALSGDPQAIEACKAHSAPLRQREQATHIHHPEVAARVAAITAQDAKRSLPFAERAKLQRSALNLPLLPTTTIGSFPQTDAIRINRRDFKAGKKTEQAYNQAIQQEIADVIARQEALDLDVLVHGEAERNDMVEYFAEHLNGFALTQFGWVQSYGSRCVKPGIVVGDITRDGPMTLDWIKYAQSLTSKHVKGMLTGPVTILCWTFPREDVSRQTIAEQLALVLKDEVADLQDAGINIIQIDEPAIREGMPLKHSDWSNYLQWAVAAFGISASSAKPETQIHTHMCYSEFNEIIDSVAALDADVITIETSRSAMELLTAFEAFEYPNEIGPGVYDIHSPNVPAVEQIEDLLEKAKSRIPLERLWVNPDCGLKTRGWEETQSALTNMVTAAKNLRQRWQ